MHLERLQQDVWHGARILRASPRLTANAVVSIVGTGANLATVSLADAMLLGPIL